MANYKFSDNPMSSGALRGDKVIRVNPENNDLPIIEFVFRENGDRHYCSLVRNRVKSAGYFLENLDAYVAWLTLANMLECCADIDEAVGILEHYGVKKNDK